MIGAGLIDFGSFGERKLRAVLAPVVAVIVIVLRAGLRRHGS